MRVKWDILVILEILALGSISVLIISSINPTLARNQLIYWIIGFILLFLISHFDYRIFTRYSTGFYVACLITLVLLLFLGEAIRGSTRWFDFAFFRFQPSELTKIATILTLSNFYTSNLANNFKNITKGLLIIAPATLLVFIQPDIGNSLAFLAIWLGIVLASGIKLKHIASLVLLTTIVSFFLIEFLAPYQQERLKSFINPARDPLGAGYNIIQSKIAIGSGLLLGRGYSQGTQSQLQFLPEAESDFIFASIAEQLGLLGAAIVLVVSSSLVVRLISYINRADRQAQLIIVGALSYLIVQFSVNVGMNLGLLPVTGITFPLVSYGGSSLITNMILFGIVFSIIRQAKQ